ncbi:MAG: HD domain-containing protein [Lachnospiraceae bacterium]|nr:HD domain-containing protein [Lachnospiraceae bacterium]
MKRILIIDGNADDEAKVKKSLGDEYDVLSFSYFDVNNMALSTVITIANTLDSLDAYSGGRSLRTAVVSRDIAKNLGWDEKECQNIYFVALLHDIGMITMPDVIVHKPGRLTEEEADIVKRHPREGAKILRDIDVLEHLAECVLYHHERWDGTGYPEGLSGETIPLFARVIAIADAYNAMSTDRIYRPRMSNEKIISEFLRCRGGQFDPDITDVFVFMLKEGYAVDPQIEQTKEASERVARDSGLRSFIAQGYNDSDDPDREMDALTGLFKRAYLNTRVGNKISKERTGALMLIDITGLDKIAEEKGGESSDALVTLLADRLKSLFREADVVSRIEDDRFAVFVSGDSGKSVIRNKAKMIENMTKEEEFAPYKSLAGIVIAISMCQEDGVTFEELYGTASARIEEAKEAIE